MKTKKVITLLALLLAGVFVSAQSYMDNESIRLEKERLNVLNQQISGQDLSAHYYAMMSWAQVTGLFPKSANPRVYNNMHKDEAFNGSPSAYVQYYEENGRVKPRVFDDQPSSKPPRYIPGTLENGFKPIVP